MGTQLYPMFIIIYGYFYAPTPQLSSCNRVHMATKLKIFAICSFTEKKKQTEKKQKKTPADPRSIAQNRGVHSLIDETGK